MLKLSLTSPRFAGIPMPDLADYMTTEEAARVLGFHVEHVRRLVRSGGLKGRKMGIVWLVLRSSVHQYRERAQSEAKRGPKPKR